MLFQHQDFDPGARQQTSQHHAGGPATGDTAVHGDFLSLDHMSLVPMIVTITCGHRRRCRRANQSNQAFAN
jgi:hypothetical protein